MIPIKRNDLDGLLDSLGNAKVAVIGDFSIDAYLHLDNSRSEVSLETGLWTQTVKTARFLLGGASNVASNLCALGCGKVFAFGVAGTDVFGPELRLLLDGIGVDTRGLLVQERNWLTQTFVKPIQDDAELARIDFGNWNTLEDKLAVELLMSLEDVLRNEGVNTVIVNQQAYLGIHNSAVFAEGLKTLISCWPQVNFLLDSRAYCDRYDGTIRKINRSEAARLCEKPDDEAKITVEDAMIDARTLAARWRMPVLVTCGSEGCIVAMPNSGRPQADDVQADVILPILYDGPVDTVGAGDTTIAGLAAGLSVGASLNTAACLGCAAAAVTIRKLKQTGTATPAEIRAIL